MEDFQQELRQCGVWASVSVERGDDEGAALACYQLLVCRIKYVPFDVTLSRWLAGKRPSVVCRNTIVKDSGLFF